MLTSTDSRRFENFTNVPIHLWVDFLMVAYNVNEMLLPWYYRDFQWRLGWELPFRAAIHWGILLCRASFRTEWCLCAIGCQFLNLEQSDRSLWLETKRTNVDYCLACKGFLRDSLKEGQPQVVGCLPICFKKLKTWWWRVCPGFEVACFLIYID